MAMDGNSCPIPKMPLQTMNHVPHSHHAHQIHGCIISSAEEMHEEEELDPRIQVELEKLNRATEEINRIELELDDARAAFRQVLSDSSQRLNGLAKKLGACVDKARPYYDSRIRLKEAHLDSQKAALRFERACSMHEAAKEMVQLAEEGYKRREMDVDPTWQEMLNHATMKVNDAERERMESEDYHQCSTLAFKKKDEEVQKLQKDLKRAIAKSKPYFEMKAKFNQVMEDHKRNVSRLEEDVCSTKALYSEALRSLEAISDDIHRQRLERRQKMQLGIREAGVGAESPSPPPSWVKGAEGSVASSGFLQDGDSFSGSSLGRSIHMDKFSVKSQGIMGRDFPLCHHSAIPDSNFDDGVLDSDPLNVVVFKNPPKESKLSSQLAASSAIYKDSSSHEARIENAPKGSDWDSMVTDLQNIDREVLSEEMRGLSSEECRSYHSAPPRHNQRHTSGQRRKDLNFSPLVSDPSFSPQDVNVYHQSSLSRAQEWVNKSPIPQQRRFVKSKSLIDASSTLTVTKIPSSLSPLSSSLTSDAMKSLEASEMQTQDRMLPPESIDPLGVSASVSLGNQQPTSVIKSAVSVSIPRSLSSTPDQFSPLSTSPSTLRESPPIRKSPKLRGLILRVDADAMNQTSMSSPPLSRTPVVKSTTVVTEDTSTVVSTNLPDFKVSSPRQQQQVITAVTPQPPQPVNVTKSLLMTVPVASSTPAQSSSYSAFPSTTSPVSVAKSLVSKVSSYSSKTAPSTLGTSYHLPSPTLTRLSLVPPAVHRQVVSPTPLSPSGDRFSIRSDSLSASNRGSLLKVPSDSSDTESIASTGPMLDDDQVEYLTMDFSEQSITSQHIEEDEMNEFIEDGPLSCIQRGHWSRMSLPPRLSYLEGYLDRARHMSSRNHDGEGAAHQSEQGQRDDAVNEDTLSMEGSVDNDPDTLKFSPIDEPLDTEQASPFMEEKFGFTDEVNITFTIDCALDRDNEENSELNEDDVMRKERVISEACNGCSENFVCIKHEDVSCQEENVISDRCPVSAEATVVLSPVGDICEVDNSDSNV